MTDKILQEERDGVTLLTLNDPENGNRVSNSMASDLRARLLEAGERSKLIVLRAAGDDFCLGRARGPQGSKGPDRPPEALELREVFKPAFDCYGAFREAAAPILGIVQGDAASFGCAIAGLCDLTIASEAARFQLPELGHRIMPTMAMSALLDRIPRKALLHMVYSGAWIDARTALSYGLVSQVVPADGLDEAADALVARMLAAPLPALRAVKEFARFGYETDINTAVGLAQNLHATVNASSRMKE